MKDRIDTSQIVAGVGIGGLTDIFYIKILICYILLSVKQPVSKKQLLEMFFEYKFVNYFYFCDTLGKLIESGHITPYPIDNDEYYTLNELGIETAQKLDFTLPRSLKDNAVSATLNVLARLKNERDNEVIIEKIETGCIVKCAIHDTDYDLMKFEVYMPDISQAEFIKERLLENPTLIYKGLIDLITQQEEFDNA